MRKMTQRLFPSIGTAAKRFDPLKIATQQLFQSEMDMPSKSASEKSAVALLKKTLEIANDTFDSITSQKKPRGNIAASEALSTSRIYFQYVESIVKGIEACNYNELEQSERAILSQAYSSLVRFQYKVGSAKERENIKERIDRALILDPKNSVAYDYKLELGINYVNPNPTKP